MSGHVAQVRGRLSSPACGGGAEQAKRREAEGGLAFAPSGPSGHLPASQGRTRQAFLPEGGRGLV